MLKNFILKQIFYFYGTSGVDFQLRTRDHLTQQFHTYTPKCILYVFILHLADLAWLNSIFYLKKVGLCTKMYEVKSNVSTRDSLKFSL